MQNESICDVKYNTVKKYHIFVWILIAFKLSNVSGEVFPQFKDTINARKEG